MSDKPALHDVVKDAEARAKARAKGHTPRPVPPDVHTHGGRQH